jgi:HK97 family phage major capsid protein
VGKAATVALLDDLRTKRAAAREAADAVLTRAATEGRDLSAEEAAAHQGHVVAEREASDALEEAHAAELAEVRAAATRRPAGPAAPREPVLQRTDSFEKWCQTRGLVEPPAADQPPPSFDKFLRGIASGNWEGAEQERALSEGTLTAGGHLVPTPLSARVIDLARNQTRVMQAGAITVPMTAQTLKLARLTVEGSPAWKSENAAITAADMTFDSVTFTARTLVRLVTLSVELFEDADPSSEDVIARSFAAQLALELDRAALIGTGTPPEPRGILNQTGVTLLAHGANGSVIGSPPAAGTMGWEFLVDGVATVRAANFEPNAQIAAPRTTQSLAKLRDTTNQYIAPPSYLDGIPRLVTKQVPINVTVGSSADTSYVFTGQWDQCMIGIRTSFNLQFLRERFLADNLQYAFLAYLRADVQLAQPAAFAVDTGVRG